MKRKLNIITKAVVNTLTLTAVLLTVMTPNVVYGGSDNGTYDMSNVDDVNELPSSIKIQDKFTTMTDSDPLSIVTVTVNNGSRNFKKYQDIAYMLKYDWFTTGLFGLKFEYTVSDDLLTAQLNCENKLPYSVKNVYVEAVDMTTGKLITFAGHDDYTRSLYTPQGGSQLIEAYSGIDSPIDALADNIFITSVSFEYLNNDTAFHAYYNFDDETLLTYIDGDVFPFSTGSITKLTYDVLKNR